MNHQPTFAISEKPTLRNSGTMMYDMYVKHAVGIDEIAYAISMEYLNDIKLTRNKVLASVARNIAVTQAWDQMLEEEAEKAYKVAETLFPELKHGKTHSQV